MGVLTSRDYIAFMKSRDRVFPLVSNDVRHSVVRKVHPYKQVAVDKICSLAEQYSDCVKRVIVFGSAVTMECHQDSDIDLCIEWNEPYRDQIGALMDRPRDFVDSIYWIVRENCYVSEYDIIHWNNNDGSSVFKDILEKGVVVYE